MKLSDCSLLVALNISQWTARKYDKKATETIAAKHGIDNGVGRYNKSLLPFTDMLNNITNKAAMMRLEFYANTLPYTYEGVRLLPSKNYFDFMKLMNQHIMEWRVLVDTFTQHYEELVKNAEDNLGPLYNTNDYPTPENLLTRFKIDLTVSPVPDATGFYDVLTADMAKAQAEEYIKTAENTAQKAMQECWDRLYEVVRRFPEKLASDGTLRTDHVQSMLNHAEEVCGLLAKLNIANDPVLEGMRLEVLKQLCEYNADVISSHDQTRDKVRTDAEEIMRKMSAYMGVQ